MAQPQTHIAFFGHDSADAANRRRVQAFQDDGLHVTGYMMHRRDPGDLSWENVDLGDISIYLNNIRGSRCRRAEHGDTCASRDYC